MEVMTKRMRKLDVKKMEPIAKEATRDALKTYIWPSGRDEDLTLGIRLEDEYGISSCISLASVLKTQ